MRCPRCQTENPENMKFCGECGAKLEGLCPTCGAANPPRFKFCGQCGSKLGEITGIAKVDYLQPQSYTPQFLADKIRTGRGSLEGERKLVTALFADACNFTSLSENLDPEEVHQIMDACFHLMMDHIHHYEGTIIQFTGDGVMVLFGAPIAHEDHAQRACHASLAIQKALVEFGQKVKRDYGVEFKMRIGLNSGLVVVTSIGNDLKMDYTALGDTINLASRMQTLAMPGTVLVSRNTHRLARDFFDFAGLGPVEVKGKKEAQEVFELVRAGDTATRLAAAAAKGLTRFVGRESSLDLLDEACEKACAGSGQVVGIVGEAGVGKSRLLLEFQNRLAPDDFTYLEGRCIHFGGAMPYLPILDVVRSYFSITEGEREAVIRERLVEKVGQLDRKLEVIFPPLLDLLCLKVEDELYLKLEPKQKRERIFEALRDLFLRESQDRVLVLAIDDLHWIDKTSEEFLGYLIGWLANARVLLIILHRPEYTHQWFSRSYFNRIGLDQLNLVASSELVQAILEEGRVAPDLRELILNRAAGNPLFMEELTHALIENGTIQRRHDRYVLTRNPSEFGVPDTLQGIIAARIDRLEDNLKQIMQVASVIGREFAFRILQAITEMREDLKVNLLNLQGLELIYEKSLFPELEYIFKHALTQEVAYNSLLVNRRREIHNRIGNAVEELYSERLGEYYEFLAYHYAKAENAEKAQKYLRLAAERATGNDSLREALGLHKQSLGILRHMPETDEGRKAQVEVILEVLRILQIMGYPEDPEAVLQEGERICQELGDRRSAALILQRAGAYHTFKGDQALATASLEQAFVEAEKASDLYIMGPLAVGLGLSYGGHGEYDRAIRITSQVIQLLEEARLETRVFPGGAYAYPQLLSVCGFAFGVVGNFEKGDELAGKAVAVAHKIGHPFTVGLAEYLYGTLLMGRGRAELAQTHLFAAIEALGKAQSMMYLPCAWAWLGLAGCALGDLQTARECVDRGLKMSLASKSPLMRSRTLYPSALVCLEQGDYARAYSLAEEVVDLARQSHDRLYEGIALSLLGITGVRGGKLKLNEAEQHVREGIEIERELRCKPYESWCHMYLGELYAVAGERDKALESLRKAEGMMEGMGLGYWLERAKKLSETVVIG